MGMLCQNLGPLTLSHTQFRELVPFHTSFPEMFSLYLPFPCKGTPFTYLQPEKGNHPFPYLKPKKVPLLGRAFPYSPLRGVPPSSRRKLSQAKLGSMGELVVRAMHGLSGLSCLARVQTNLGHMWTEFVSNIVVLSHATRTFSGFSGFPSSPKINNLWAMSVKWVWTRGNDPVRDTDSYCYPPGLRQKRVKKL